MLLRAYWISWQVYSRRKNLTSTTSPAFRLKISCQIMVSHT